MKLLKFHFFNILTIILIILSLYIVFINYSNSRKPVVFEEKAPFDESVIYTANEIIYNFITESSAVVDTNIRFDVLNGSSLLLHDLLNDSLGRFFFYIQKISCHNCFSAFLEQITAQQK